MTDAERKEYKRQWYEKNKQRIAEKGVLYRVLNKDTISQKKKEYAIANRQVIQQKRKEEYRKNPEVVKQRVRKWAAENPDRAKTRRREYAAKNREQIRKNRKAYREANKDLIAQKKKDYYERNKERISARSREWSALNRDRYNETRKLRMEHNLQFRIACKLRSGLMKKISQAKASKSARTFDLLGCSMEFFLEYMSSKFQEGMSWDNHGEWHIDHIRPCASFDLTDPEQQRICFHHTNLQPLWGRDNLSKGKKNYLQWLSEQEPEQQKESDIGTKPSTAASD